MQKITYRKFERMCLSRINTRGNVYLDAIVKGIARDEWDFNVTENRNDEDILRQMINQVVTNSYLEINLRII